MDPATPWCGLASLRAALLALSVLLVCPTCTPVDGGEQREVLHVYAASSLTEAFRDLEVAFERSDPGTDVAVTFAGSQILRLQIEQGAPADVYASADPVHVRSLVDAGVVGDVRTLALNELVVIVPADADATVASFEDLSRAELLVLGTEGVPVGRYARQAIRSAEGVYGPGFEQAVLQRVVSEETNVRLVRAKVELGEADAAIVYRTDAEASEGVRSLEIPAEARVGVEYRIGVVTSSRNQGAAKRWVAFATSPDGRAILSRHGFTAP